MHKKQPKISYRTDYKYKLQEIFKGISKPSINCDRFRNKEILFSNIPILFIMSELLDLVQIPQTPYKIVHLQKLYDNFDCGSTDKLFSIEDLFYEGWLIRFIDEWRFNGWKNNIDKINEQQDIRINQIIMFLKELVKIPYDDAIYLTIDVKSDSFKQLLLNSYTDLKSLIDIGIIKENNSDYYIDSRTDVWADLGYKVLSEKLNKWISDGKLNLYNHWIDICNYLQHCWIPEKNVNDISGLYGICLDYLEQESGTWGQEERILEKYCQLDRRALLENMGIAIPENRRERHTYLSRFDDKYIVYKTQSKAHNLFFLCVRNYNRVNEGLKRRFRSLLTLPLYNIYYFHMGFQMEECAVDCLYDTELFYDAAVCLRDRIREATNTGVISDAKIIEFVNGLWEAVGNELLYDGKDNSVQNMIDFSLFLLHDEENKRENLIYKNTLFLNMFDNLVLLYDRDIPYGADIEQRLFNRIVELIEQNHNYICTYYLNLLIRLADSYKCDKREYAYVIYDIVYKGFYKWFNTAVKYNLSLSVAPQAFFAEKIWSNIFEKNYRKVSSFFNMFIDIKEKILSEAKKPEGLSILRTGELGMIYLYLATIWLDEVKANIPEKEYLRIEKQWICDFFDLHTAYELFSGEHIHILKSEYVVSRCMKVVSKFSVMGKQQFEERLKKTSPADLIFWIEYIDIADIKNHCLSIVANSDVETLTNNIAFIPTEVQLTKKIGDICWNLYNQTRGNDSKKSDYKAWVYLLKSVLAQLRSIIEKRQNLKEEYQDWIDSMDKVIMILEGREDEVLSGDSDFYKGLIYLNSENINELRRAAQYYEKYYQEQSEGGSINYLVAISSIICKLHDEGRNYAEELALFGEVSENLLSVEYDLDRSNRSELYFYTLVVYYTLKDRDSFWNIVHNMSEEYRIQYDIAVLIIKQYINDNETQKAHYLITKIESKYGETYTISELKTNVSSGGIPKNDIHFLTQPRSLLHTQKSQDWILNIKFALHTLRSLNKSELATVFKPDSVATEELEKYKTDVLPGVVVIHLLCLLFKSIVKLQEYRPYLIINGRSAEEDTYNGTLRRFFNMLVPDCLGYKMFDQSQGGTTGNIHKNGEMGKGERDLIITRDSQEIMLLEGIKLDSVNKGVIREHIEKIERYNSSGMSIATIPIYTGAQNIATLWDSYIKYLEEIKNSDQCNMIDIVTEFDWESARLEEYPHMVCRTTHFYPNANMNVSIYHILIQVGTK